MKRWMVLVTTGRADAPNYRVLHDDVPAKAEALRLAERYAKRTGLMTTAAHVKAVYPKEE
jgi:hypothetical protein